MRQLQFIILLVALLMPSCFGNYTNSLSAKSRYDGVGMRRDEISGALYAPSLGCMLYEGGSGWNYDNGFSAGFALSYGFWFSRHVGITTGLRVSYFSYEQKGLKFSLQEEGTVTVTDGAGLSAVNATLEVSSPGVGERQTMTMFEIPLQLTFQTRHLFCNLGAAFSTAITNYSEYSYSESEYSLLSVQGFGVMPPTPISSDIDQENDGSYVPSKYKQPLFVSLAAEVGLKFYFDDRNVVSVSVFGRYALNDCELNDNASPYVLNNSTSIAVAPMHTNLVDLYRAAECGLRIAYHFGFGRKFRISRIEQVSNIHQ
ncbi:MAG: outer membrane beta-barrel protein [Bacteroidales bacterium]|nr:outer membrane beta-barrel protein [Bacteroidales bacterium]